jgi:hypothetical protein
MKFHDRQSSERCIRKLISRHCLDKTRTRWNDFLFLITDDRDFRPQTCTNGLVFRECKHIKNIFEDVYFTKNSFHITLKWICLNKCHRDTHPKPYIFMIRVTRQIKCLIAQTPGVIPDPLPEVSFLMVEIPTPKPYIFMIRVTRQIKCLIAQALGGHTPPPTWGELFSSPGL